MPAACRYPGAAGSHRGRRAVRLCGQGAGVPCPRGEHGRAGARGLVMPPHRRASSARGELVLVSCATHLAARAARTLAAAPGASATQGRRTAWGALPLPLPGLAEGPRARRVCRRGARRRSRWRAVRDRSAYCRAHPMPPSRTPFNCFEQGMNPRQLTRALRMRGWSPISTRGARMRPASASKFRRGQGHSSSAQLKAVAAHRGAGGVPEHARAATTAVDAAPGQWRSRTLSKCGRQQGPEGGVEARQPMRRHRSVICTSRRRKQPRAVCIAAAAMPRPSRKLRRCRSPQPQPVSAPRPLRLAIPSATALHPAVARCGDVWHTP
jgi:hypothetical protein